MGSPAAVVVQSMEPAAARQLAQLLDAAVRGASYEVHAQVRLLARDLRAWSLASAQRDAREVFRNTPVGVPALASDEVGEARCAHEHIDVIEAARRTGRSTGVLRRHCRDGRYGAVKVAGAWRLDAGAVDRVVAERGQQGAV